ncbi:MAG: hypothetical protein WAO35_04910 [Terriglobia bacterium]
MSETKMAREALRHETVATVSDFLTVDFSFMPDTLKEEPTFRTPLTVALVHTKTFGDGNVTQNVSRWRHA